MKMKMFLLFVGILFVSACGKERINEQHDIYLSNKGWEIKESTDVETSILTIPNELISNYEASGISFLKKHLGEEVTQYSYELKAKDIEGNHVKAIVYEAEEGIIGGYGILPSWTPGIFNLDEKERLISEQLMKHN